MQETSHPEKNEMYLKRFEMLKKLIRIDRMLRGAKIIHKDNLKD